MKIGSVIYRKDMPMIQYEIIGESDTSWSVKIRGKIPGTIKEGLVFKDDDRWEELKDKVGG